MAQIAGATVAIEKLMVLGAMSAAGYTNKGNYYAMYLYLTC